VDAASRLGGAAAKMKMVSGVGGSGLPQGEQLWRKSDTVSVGRSALEYGNRGVSGRTPLLEENRNFCRAAVFWWYKAGVSLGETRAPILGVIRHKRKLNMRNLLLTMAICGLPIIANAHGCIKGAAVGGVVGHVAGHHAVAGAAVGCVIGHHRAKVKEREAAQNAAQSQVGSGNTTGSTPSH
jgi:hypothetical protein